MRLDLDKNPIQPVVLIPFRTVLGSIVSSWAKETLDFTGYLLYGPSYLKVDPLKVIMHRDG